MKLIIQIPCYNEAETLEIALNGLPKQIDGIDTIEYLIINDGSKDNTISIIAVLFPFARYFSANGPSKQNTAAQNGSGIMFSFQNMLQAHLQNGPHMVIRQRVPDVLTLPPEFDQVHLLQHPKLVGNGTLAQLHALSNVANAQLPFLKKRQDVHPRRVREGLEKLRDLL